MSYRNGKELFPPSLLEQIQRYAQGTCVYIPRVGEKTRKTNGLQGRNAEICCKYEAGQSVRSLAEEYFLSPQAIYKILSGDRKKG